MTGDSFNLHFLLHSADLVEDRLRIVLQPLGIGPRQARVINAMHRMGPVSQVKLAKEFNVTAASMSTMTSRLISAGLISRQTDPNELRSNILTLTDTGKSLLEDVREAWRQVDKVIEDAIGREKSKELAELTRQLRDALGGHVPGTSDDANRR